MSGDTLNQMRETWARQTGWPQNGAEIRVADEEYISGLRLRHPQSDPVQGPDNQPSGEVVDEARAGLQRAYDPDQPGYCGATIVAATVSPVEQGS